MQDAANPWQASGRRALEYAKTVEEFAAKIVEYSQKWKRLNDLRDAEEGVRRSMDSAKRLVRHAEVSAVMASLHRHCTPKKRYLKSAQTRPHVEDLRREDEALPSTGTDPREDVWFHGFSSYVSPSFRRRYLEALCSRYNSTPAGKQLPAAYIDMNEPATQQQPPPPCAKRVVRRVSRAPARTRARQNCLFATRARQARSPPPSSTCMCGASKGLHWPRSG